MLAEALAYAVPPLRRRRIALNVRPVTRPPACLANSQLVSATLCAAASRQHGDAAATPSCSEVTIPCAEVKESAPAWGCCSRGGLAGAAACDGLGVGAAQRQCQAAGRGQSQQPWARTAWPTSMTVRPLHCCYQPAPRAVFNASRHICTDIASKGCHGPAGLPCRRGSQRRQPVEHASHGSLIRSMGACSNTILPLLWQTRP